MANARNVRDAILRSRLPKMTKAVFYVSAYLAAMHRGSYSDPTNQVSNYRRGAEWLNWSIFEGPASELSGSMTISMPTPIVLPTVSPSTCARSKARSRSKPAAISINTGSKKETADEIAGCQTLDRHRRSQDERQSRRRVLERAEGDRKRPGDDSVGLGGHDRHRSPSR